jgi:hypothetical protein
MGAGTGYRTLYSYILSLNDILKKSRTRQVHFHAPRRYKASKRKKSHTSEKISSGSYCDEIFGEFSMNRVS